MVDQESPIQLIVGLGNPGQEYKNTRHNAGYWFIDEVIQEYGGTISVEKKFYGEIGAVQIADIRIKILKPTAYMNESGRAVQSVSEFYKLAPHQVLIAHDDIDLSPATAKYKLGGGHGGHNGLRDIFNHIGQDFWRARIGVGHPGHKDQVTDYVLNKAPSEEHELIMRSIHAAVQDLPSKVTGT
ncbi:MAG: aminoacyl-tRNA hydrolase [Pseudomonadota bacterium]